MKQNLKLFFLASAIVLASCNDDFDEVASPSGSTIKAVADSNENLDIFSAAIVKTGLAAALDNNNAGAYTVFAPSDDAFVAYFKTALAKGDPYTEADVLSYINTEMTGSSTVSTSALGTRLTYHMISSEIPASAITGAQGFTTMNSARLSISKSTDIILNGTSKVVGASIDASNGVVYVIDKVLSPVSTASVLGYLGMSVNYSASVTDPAIGGGLETGADATDTDFDIFTYAIRKGKVAPLIQPNVSILPDQTVFVPNDKAVREDLEFATEAETIAALKAMSVEEVAAWVKTYIVPGRVVSTDLQDGKQFQTMQSGVKITSTVNGSDIVVSAGEGDATIITKDVLTNSGVVHIINGTL